MAISENFKLKCNRVTFNGDYDSVNEIIELVSLVLGEGNYIVMPRNNELIIRTANSVATTIYLSKGDVVENRFGSLIIYKEESVEVLKD